MHLLTCLERYLYTTHLDLAVVRENENSLFRNRQHDVSSERPSFATTSQHLSSRVMLGEKVLVVLMHEMSGALAYMSGQNETQSEAHQCQGV